MTLTPLTVTANPSALTFPQTPQSTNSAGKDITFTNETPELVDFDDLQFTGADKDDFDLTRNTCHGALAPAASCTLRVKFAPRARARATRH